MGDLYLNQKLNLTKSSSDITNEVWANLSYQLLSQQINRYSTDLVLFTIYTSLHTFKFLFRKKYKSGKQYDGNWDSCVVLNASLCLFLLIPARYEEGGI